MPLIGRRVVEGVEHVVVPVEHRFSLEEAVLAVMAAKSTVRPGPGVKVTPLKVSEVRAALMYAAKHADRRHQIVDRYLAETEGGPLHRLADWIRAELVRLGVFST
jgi:hypothetical protein